MIENYSVDINGVIKQINIPEHIKYDENYVKDRYVRYGEIINYMSYLRYGYLIGTIGKVPDSILDFGYGNGSFLEVCSKTIKNCFGHDISGYDLPEKCENVEDIFSQKFEVISFFDSLEHVDDIYFLDKLNCDYILISVPECHNFSDEWFFNWKHRRENEHLYHFSKESLTKFMNSQGYELLNMSNIEDIIRTPVDKNSNIITAIYSKKK